MSVTASYVSARLPACLSSLVDDYFGRIKYPCKPIELDPYKISKRGQWEECKTFTFSKTHVNTMLTGACNGGHTELVNFMIARGANDWDEGFAHACEGGHIDIVNLMIAKGVNNWNWGLANACQGGHIDIINLMIAKGADDWDDGLSHACRGGHIDIINLMIAKGTDYWNGGLSWACLYGHIDAINLMIDKGANECGHCEKSMDEHRAKKK